MTYKMDWVAFSCGLGMCGVGIILVSLGVSLMVASNAAKRETVEPLQNVERLALPAMGKPTYAQRNEVWELRNGEIAQISGPIGEYGHIAGVSQKKPIHIDGYVGSSLMRMYMWRVDGVSTSGDRNEDLIKKRDDLKGEHCFDEDGYATHKCDDSNG